jgi:leader peptidase (prepilin peptidase)/N-methyltransferase
MNNGSLLFVLVTLFIAGAIVGSFINVVVARLPYEKSVLWPGSRCFRCLRAIPLYDNIPLVSYWLLGGKCRGCKAPFSMRYFLVELLVAVGFVLLFYFEVVQNIHRIPAFNDSVEQIRFRLFTRGSLPMLWFFLHHATLFSLLVAAAFCDLQDRTIPLGITLTGTVVGLVLATVLPWPWPSLPAQAMPQDDPGLRFQITEWWQLGPNQIAKSGLYHWPVWQPQAGWLGAGSTLMGLLTGVAGALTGTLMLRIVKLLFEKGLGKEALGLGDADMMMMAGAFLGWQPIIVAFLVGALVSLVFAVPRIIMRGDNTLPFGPGLAVGTVLTWLGWHWIGPQVHSLFFHGTFLAVLGGLAAVVLFLLSFLIGRVQGAAKKK